MIDDLQIMTGIDIPISKLKVTLHQPRLKEIAILGENRYFSALTLFSISPEKLKIKAEGVTRWQLFQEALKQDIPGEQNIRVLMSNFLQLFLTDRLTLGPRSIIIDTPSGIVNIEADNFDLFQYYIGRVGGIDLLTDKEEDDYRPANAKAAYIADKLRKARGKKKQAAAARNGESFIAKYVRAAATMTANSMDDIINMTVLQLRMIVQTYLNYEQYDLDVKSRLAGAKNEKKLEHWLEVPLGAKKEELVGKLE